MRTFLRKIRKSLFDSGSARKYLLYSIGEILLVMVGILLALQVNNWNEWRKDRVKEKEVLQSLKENLEANEIRLKKMIKQHIVELQASKIIISTIENKLTYHDSLDIHFAWAFNTGSEGVVLSYMGYETMKNSGYDIVDNTQLKNEIIGLFEGTYKGIESSHNRLSQYYDEVQKLKHERLMRKDGFRFTPFDFESLLEDKEFLSWLKTIKNNRGWLNNFREKSLLETTRVLQLIKDELGEEGTKK